MSTLHSFSHFIRWKKPNINETYYVRCDHNTEISYISRMNITRSGVANNFSTTHFMKIPMNTYDFNALCGAFHKYPIKNSIHFRFIPLMIFMNFLFNKSNEFHDLNNKISILCFYDDWECWASLYRSHCLMKVQ